MKDDSAVCKGLKEDYHKKGEKKEILFSPLTAFMSLSDGGSLYLVAAVGFSDMGLFGSLFKRRIQQTAAS